MLPPHGLPPVLAILDPGARAAWIIGHILASVLILPLVEELAFRGYLLRRVRSAAFESVIPRGAGLGALLVSAAVFGVCQGGSFWLPGMFAGVIFGLVYMRTGRLGEAVLAHAVTNGLIAGTVLAGSQWQFW